MISLRSKITQKVLSFYMLNLDARQYINQLARSLDVDSGNLTRKLYELEQEGILRKESEGLETFFLVNHEYPLLEHYRKIVLATVGLEATLKQVLSNIKGIHRAFIFGSYAEGTMDASSDVDLMVVGTHRTTEVIKRISELQRQVNRPINVMNYSIDEFENKKENDSFLKSVLSKSRVELI